MAASLPANDESGPLERLLAAYDAVTREPGLPRIVVLYGETGRGKTYWVQHLYDALAARRPGYWQPGLTPAWPPQIQREVHIARKRVAPRHPDTSETVPDFFWAGASAAPAEGAADIDTSADLLFQLHRQWSGLEQARDRRLRVRSAVLGAALDALGLVVPVIGTASTLTQRSIKLAQLADDEPGDPLLRSRAALHASFRAVGAEFSGAPPTTVLAIDDAPAVSPEVFQIASGLVSDSTHWGTIDDLYETVDTLFLPTGLPDRLPGPVLYVCTAWEHRLGEAFEDDAFQIWLSEAAALGCEIEWIRCEEFSRDDAAELLHTAFDLEDSASIRIIDHLSGSVSNTASVNPLVLASAVGRLSETAATWGAESALAADSISRLSNVPEQHVKDRLEKLKISRPGGLRAHALVELAARYAEATPARLLRLAGVQAWSTEDAEVDEQLRLASDHGIVRTLSDDQTLGFLDGVLSVDPDVFRYLNRLPAEDAVERALDRSSSLLLRWLLDEGLSGLRAPLPHSSAARRVLQAAARRVLAAAEACADADPDTALVALTLLRQPEPEAIARCASEAGTPARGFAYGFSRLDRLGDVELLEAIDHFGGSRVSAQIALRRLRNAGRARGPVEHTLSEFLADHPDPRMRLAYVVALQDAGDDEAAVEVLRDIVPTFPHAGFDLSRSLERLDRPVEAREALETAAKVLPAAAVRLAGALEAEGREEDAVPLLLPFVDSDQAVAPALARIYERAGDHEACLAVLRRGSAVYGQVALTLSRYLLRRDDPDAAIAALDPWVEHLQDAAIAFAQLQIHNGATEVVVERFKSRERFDRNTSVLLARLLRWRDPGFSVQLLDRWARAGDLEAARLRLRILLRLRPEDIGEEDLAGLGNQRIRDAYRCARDLLVNRPDRAMEMVQEYAREKGARSFFATCFGGLADAVRPDLIGDMLDRTRSRVAHLAAASLTLTLMLRLEPEYPDVETNQVVARLWPAEEIGLEAARVIEAQLWYWARYEDMTTPCWQALSLFATWRLLPHRPDSGRFEQACGRRLEEEAQGDASAYPVVLRMSERDRTAREILDGIIPPLAWRLDGETEVEGLVDGESDGIAEAAIDETIETDEGIDEIGTAPLDAVDEGSAP